MYTRYNALTNLDQERDQDFFESVSEEEIIYLWRSIKGKGLSEDEAWQAIVTGIALDMAFSKTKSAKQIEH
jgi:Fe-S cluster assembly scaffold protein SufB